MPIQVEHLTHTYMTDSPFAATALEDVSLTIEDGELIGLLGHTGSGKTTLVQHLNGLLKPTSGKVVVDGLDIDRKRREPAGGAPPGGTGVPVPGVPAV